MDLGFRIETFQLSLVDCKVLVVQIANKDRAGAILRELVGCGSANPERRIGSCDDGNARLESSVDSLDGQC